VGRSVGDRFAALLNLNQVKSPGGIPDVQVIVIKWRLG